jgi:hypothetical protein
MTLTSIVPGLFPSIDGVGHYALGHALLLRERSGLDTRFIVADPEWRGPDQVEGFQVSQLARRTTGNLMPLLPEAGDSTVVLHYGGYGYAKRGCPVWLVLALERWRTATSERRLVTVFHELYATGRPWTSSFWLSPLQKNLTARLASLSDFALTSLEENAQILAAMNPGLTGRLQHLPVFSNIGEPVETAPLDKRRRRMVVFGTRGRRLEVYKRSAGDLNRICRALEIEEIVDIGRGVEFEFAKALDVPVVVCGELPSAEVSELLLDSIAGVIDYPASLLGKSGIFAAYCSHRMIPIVADRYGFALAEGLEETRHYWRVNEDQGALGLAAGQVVADEAFEWYQAHDLRKHAEILAKWLGGSPVRGVTV